MSDLWVLNQCHFLGGLFPSVSFVTFAPVSSCAGVVVGVFSLCWPFTDMGRGESFFCCSFVLSLPFCLLSFVLFFFSYFLCLLGLYRPCRPWSASAADR